MKSINIITGASKGLGKSLAINLANNNSDCILIARNRLELQEVARECIRFGSKAKVLCADFSSINEIEDLVEQLKTNLPKEYSYIMNEIKEKSLFDLKCCDTKSCSYKSDGCFVLTIPEAYDIFCELYIVELFQN